MRGVYVDREYLDSFIDRLETITKDIEQTVHQGIEAVTERAWPEFNIQSPKQLSTFYYDDLRVPLFDGRRTTDKDALQHFATKKYPLAEELLNYRQQAHRLNTYAHGPRKRLTEHNLIHTSLLLHGTVTGRLASRDPNLQNIKRDNEIKRIFGARPGYTFGQADYKQLEIRVAAWYSRDRNLIEACQHDVHWAVAKQVFAKQIDEITGATHSQLQTILRRYEILREVLVLFNNSPDKYAATAVLADKMLDHLRFMTKFITFGILYGRQAYSLAIGELSCAVEEAERYIAEFFAGFPQLATWIDTNQKHAINLGFVVQPTGRRRRFPLVTGQLIHKIRNQAVNTPIQGLASDINTTAIIRLEHEMTASNLGWPLFPVHDSIAFEVPEDRETAGLQLVQNVMTSVLEDSEIEFPIDLELGQWWGETEKVHLDGR
jgi:DNA polymerase-1